MGAMRRAFLAAVLLGLNAGCSSSNDGPAGGDGTIVTGNGGVESGGTGVGAVAGGLTGSGGMAGGGPGGVATGGFVTMSGSGGIVPAGGANSGGTTSSAGAGTAGGTAGGAPSAGGIASSGGAGGAPAGNGGTSGGAGSGAYRPCPTNGDPCKILPLGDSITWGLQYDGAYRVELFSKAVGDGKKITFTGSQSNGPAMVAGQVFPKNNEGHSGWTISQVASVVPSPALSTPPHIVLLHVGTNDAYMGSGQSTMGDRLGSLIDKVAGAVPDALIVVAKIVPMSNASWNAIIKTYNDGIPAVVQKRVDMGKHVTVIDLNTGFMPSMLSSDGVHPNKSGYDFMGDKWYAAISAVLP
jgi:lysophospholipase L1-like esterase